MTYYVIVQRTYPPGYHCVGACAADECSSSIGTPVAVFTDRLEAECELTRLHVARKHVSLVEVSAR